MPSLRFIAGVPPDRARSGFHVARGSVLTPAPCPWERTGWRAVEPQVFAEYERRSDATFRHQTYDCFTVAGMRISGRTFGGEPPFMCVSAEQSEASLRMTLVHEIGHLLALDNTAWHTRKLAHLWLLHPMRDLGTVDHLLVNTLHEAVARAALPSPTEELSVARGWHGMRRAWALIDADQHRIERIALNL